ncbi:hypothetical protein [Pseudomonas sp.]|uniref:hypothetical protein n=1 Tax=Pseudomonas sp. TaxID=306 RepID=UPI003FD75A53
MTFAQQEREHILTGYKKYVDKVSVDLEDKCDFSVEEVVEKIINIIEERKDD